MPYFSNDDIVQIATPPGPSPVGAVRLSGENVFAILARLAPGLSALRDRPVARGSYDGQLIVKLMRYRPGGRREEVCPAPARFFLMPGPGSYTREDTAEIHLPGVPALLSAVMRTIVAAGARAAAPGEFTFRAFRNGRISLAQAEAVEAVVRAGSDGERRRALARLGGGGHGHERTREWRSRILALAAALEAALDFPEEETGQEAIARALAELAGEVAAAGEAGLAAPAGRMDGNAPHAALLGLTNAGKSSLFNALLASGAEGGTSGGSLVSPDASTTRDSLRREAEWHGTRLVLSDNPGYHPAGTGAAGAAAVRGWRGPDGMDAAAWVLDGSVPLGATERAFAAGLAGAGAGLAGGGAGVVIILNKCDLPPAVTAQEAREAAELAGLAVRGVTLASAVTGAGLAGARQAIAAAASAAWEAGEARSSASDRERGQIAAALAAVRAAERELAGPGRLEIAAEEVRQAAGAFSLALGEGYAEEALTRIFSAFCVGK